MLTGANGQIGRALQNSNLPPQWILGLYTRSNCDMANPAQIKASVLSFKPDLIINCAGMTNVDQAEQTPELVKSVNFSGAATLAALASVMDIPLIHLSTDYVFDGRQTALYKPDDAMNPLNVYGASKLLSEEAIRHELPWHVIVRTSSIFSEYGPNFLTNMIDRILNQSELRIVTDVTGCPTYAAHLAEALVHMGTQILNGKTDGFGTFHYSGSPACSRYEFAEHVLAAWPSSTQPIPRLTPTISAEFAALAQRPRFSGLDCEKTTRIYGLSPKPWQPELKGVIDRILANHQPCTSSSSAGLFTH